MRQQCRWHKLVVGLAALSLALVLIVDMAEVFPVSLCAMSIVSECSSHTKEVVVHSRFRRHGPEEEYTALPTRAPAAKEAAHPGVLPNWSFAGVQQCISEGDRDVCPWCNSTFTSHYPFMAEHFQRAFIPGQPCSMPPGLLHRLETGQPITIAVLGGSMTAGHGCFDQHSRGRECAWPAKMKERLQQVYPNAQVTVKNMAKPGYSYTDVLSSGHIHTAASADVLLIDLQVNSQVYNDTDVQMESVDDVIYEALAMSHQQQRHLGIMFVESFRTCSVHQADCNKHCPARQQGHLIYNHTGSSNKYSFCNKWWIMASLERPVVHHYGLPIASYREAVWPDISTPGLLLPCYWNGLSHPDAIGHAMMADVVTYGLLRSISEAGRRPDEYDSTDGELLCAKQRPPVKFHQQSPSARYCTAHAAASAGTFMSAEQPATFQPVVNTGCWTFFEDRPGKPGWICQHDPKTHQEMSLPVPAEGSHHTAVSTAAFNSTMKRSFRGGGSKPYNTIAFEVHFSSIPQLQLTYLTSYANMGVAEVALYARHNQDQNLSWSMQQQQVPLATFTVDSAIRERFSIPRTSMFVHPSMWQQWQHHQHAQQLPAGLQEGDYLVLFRLVVPADHTGSQKFKLLSLSAC